MVLRIPTRDDLRASRRFPEGWHICTTSCPTSGVPSMSGSNEYNDLHQVPQGLH
jgi:hypothetical protein